MWSIYVLQLIIEKKNEISYMRVYEQNVLSQQKII